MRCDGKESGDMSNEQQATTSANNKIAEIWNDETGGVHATWTNEWMNILCVGERNRIVSVAFIRIKSTIHSSYWSHFELYTLELVSHSWCVRWSLLLQLHSSIRNALAFSLTRSLVHSLSLDVHFSSLLMSMGAHIIYSKINSMISKMFKILRQNALYS